MTSSAESPAADPLVLIVEDEEAQVDLLTYNLQRKGYRTVATDSGRKAFRIAVRQEPDVMILDWMLPDISGIEICRRLRESSRTRNLPIVIVTARGEEEDRIRGLETGADDYMVKPYSPNELMARIQAVLRRRQPEAGDDVLCYADIAMDLARHRVSRDGKPVRLGPTEFRLLRVLLEQPTRVLSREQLLNLAWGHDIHVQPRTVDVHIRRLRRVLNADGAQDLIRTVKKAGYSIDSESA